MSNGKFSEPWLFLALKSLVTPFKFHALLMALLSYTNLNAFEQSMATTSFPSEM